MPAEESKPAVPEPPAKPEAAKPAAVAPRKRRRWVLPLVALALIASSSAFRKLSRRLNTVSTDDAYVNSYVTFVAPRVARTGGPRPG